MRVKLLILDAYKRKYNIVCASIKFVSHKTTYTGLTTSIYGFTDILTEITNLSQSFSPHNAQFICYSRPPNDNIYLIEISGALQELI